MIGWRWDGSGYILDYEGNRIHVLDTPIQWMCTQLHRAWTQKVGRDMESRQGLTGFHRLDASTVRNLLQTYSYEDQALLRVALNGTFFTKDKMIHNGKLVDTNCPLRGELDSIPHRHWTCPAVQELVQHLSQDVHAFVHQAPECTIHHAWPTESQVKIEFRRELSQFCHEHPAPAVITCSTAMYLFVDGSCRAPSIPHLRIASWGFCLADLDHGTFIPVDSGIVEGPYHTTLRAEIVAAIQAVTYGIRAQTPFFLWTDNQAVHDGLSRIVFGAFVLLTPKKKNHDLWNKLAALTQIVKFKGYFQHVAKVVSRQDQALLSCVITQWAARGNECTDRLALEAWQHLPGKLRTLWYQAVERYKHRRVMTKVLFDHYLGVSKLHVASKPDSQDRVAAQWQQQVD